MVAIIDNSLTLKRKIDDLVRKIQYKHHALRRIRIFFTVEKIKIVDNAFIDIQFNYATLISTLCRKTFYSKIENNHQQTLKVTYDINDSYNLLLRNSYVSIHQRDLQFLVTEIFNSISQINPEFMWSFFKQKKGKGPILNVPRAQSTYYGANAVHVRGSVV